MKRERRVKGCIAKRNVDEVGNDMDQSTRLEKDKAALTITAHELDRDVHIIPLVFVAPPSGNSMPWWRAYGSTTVKVLASTTGDDPFRRRPPPPDPPRPFWFAILCPSLFSCVYGVRC